jgi:hypothetical protein
MNNFDKELEVIKRQTMKGLNLADTCGPAFRDIFLQILIQIEIIKRKQKNEN